MRLIIDADPAVYRAGFASQETEYAIVVEWTDGKIEQMFWDNGNDMNAWLRERKDQLTVLDKEKTVTAKPIEYAIQATLYSIQGIIKAVANRYGYKAYDLDVQLLLTGKDNFREETATIQGYKANRTQERPVHYQAIRDFMEMRFDAQIVDGHEADDEVSILAKAAYNDGQEVCIATIDKDLDQIPGIHYDYLKKVFYTVDPVEAICVFYRQCMSGDATDNIQGLYKVGIAKAEKMLNAFIEEWIEVNNKEPFENIEQFEIDLWDMLVCLYQDNIEAYPERYPEGITAAEAALETARLVKMQDYRGQLWTPPGAPDEETT